MTRALLGSVPQSQAAVGLTTGALAERKVTSSNVWTNASLAL